MWGETVSTDSTKEEFRLSSLLISSISASQVGLFFFLIPTLIYHRLLPEVFSMSFSSDHRFSCIHTVTMTMLSSISLFFLDKETENPILPTS